MARYAEIKDGIVVNIALASAAFARSQGWVAAGACCIGDLWDGEGFTPPPAPPDPVPAAVTRRQGQLTLLQLDKLDGALATIAAIEDPVQRRAAQIEYDADTWERSNAFLSALWEQLGGTPETLDDAFRRAAAL